MFATAKSNVITRPRGLCRQIQLKHLWTSRKPDVFSTTTQATFWLYSGSMNHLYYFNTTGMSYGKKQMCVYLRSNMYWKEIIYKQVIDHTKMWIVGSKWHFCFFLKSPTQLQTYIHTSWFNDRGYPICSAVVVQKKNTLGLGFMISTYLFVSSILMLLWPCMCRLYGLDNAMHANSYPNAMFLASARKRNVEWIFTESGPSCKYSTNILRHCILDAKVSYLAGIIHDLLKQNHHDQVLHWWNVTLHLKNTITCVC